MLVQQIVQHPVAHQYDLDIQRNGFRFQRNRACQAQRLGHRFDLRLARSQRAFQPFPGVGLLQDAEHFQNKVTAVGPMQGARPDQRKVRRQHAHLRPVLDETDQVAMVRMLLDDHRRSVVGAVVDQDVYLVALKRLPVRRRHQERQLRLLVRRSKIVGVLDHVLLHGIQVFKDIRELFVTLAHLFERMLDGKLRRVTIQLLDLVVRCLAPHGNFLDKLFQIFLQRSNGLFDSGAFLLR